MLITIRNLMVNLIAAFIPGRDARHDFRSKYRRKSKFRKLRDDNKEILVQIGLLNSRLNSLTGDINRIKRISQAVNLLRPLDEPFQDYLSIACIAKNESPYIKEWIEYHKIVGVDRFYFYDNESNDNTREVLEPYIKDGTVVYKFTPGKGMQIPAYQDAVLKTKDKTRWLALIDLDEFMVPNEKDNIKDFLKEFERYPGIGINWVPFDSNGHRTKPISHGGLVTANYTRVSKDYTCHINSDAIYTKDQGLLIKSIVNPKMVVDIVNPHYAIYCFGKYAVNEKFDLILKLYKTDFHTHDKIQINHYQSKSKEECMRKREGLTADGGRQRKFDEKLVFFEQETTEDLAIQKFLPKLKHVLDISN